MNRVAGLGVLLFLALHIVDIFVAGFGPGLFTDLLFIYKGPVVRILGIFLVILALLHMFIMYIQISVEQITFQTIVGRYVWRPRCILAHI